MKRRNFIAKGTTGGIGACFVGCSSVTVKRELSPHAFDKKVSKPVGTMPMSKLGTTDIKVSKFSFGSHMRKDITPFEKEREWMVREAFDLGINLFDVYDKEQECYQYEPMGRYLAPIINDVVISISILPWEGRTLEQELERNLRLFGRDYIDMVRIHSYSSKSSNWNQWEKLFRFKEQGKIRAIGIPCHHQGNLEEPLAQLPLDYVIFPFNFYHNWTWFHKNMVLDEYDSLIPKLRRKGIGIVTMKPFAGDNLVTPFKRLVAEYDKSGETNYAKACLRYVINSGLDIDTTLGGMYYPYHIYENAEAYFNSEMSTDERKILRKLRNVVKNITKYMLPEHYQFLEAWVPDSFDDSDLNCTA
ncbi:MAG: hypothetical protein HOC71_00965 [Candidatus Latescibacteria bacterium]|jgi:predicted aldo/keto reductase-like oxidoreductase|nr:hypothetical protein [Candidatus Latescibacterota bacterium]